IGLTLKPNSDTRRRVSCNHQLIPGRPDAQAEFGPSGELPAIHIDLALMLNSNPRQRAFLDH
ncbi:hypothetical protein PoB_004863400, partial [Plakobranchus ocellatus]